MRAAAVKKKAANLAEFVKKEFKLPKLPGEKSLDQFQVESYLHKEEKNKNINAKLKNKI